MHFSLSRAPCLRAVQVPCALSKERAATTRLRRRPKHHDGALMDPGSSVPNTALSWLPAVRQTSHPPPVCACMNARLAPSPWGPAWSSITVSDSHQAFAAQASTDANQVSRQFYFGLPVGTSLVEEMRSRSRPTTSPHNRTLAPNQEPSNPNWSPRSPGFPGPQNTTRP